MRKNSPRIALFHFKKLINTFLRIIITFNRRRSRCQQQNRIMSTASFFCHIYSIIPWRTVRFIGAFPFFIDNNQAYIFKGSKNCAACSDCNFCQTTFYSFILVHTLSQRQTAVNNCNRFSEQLPKPAYSLRSKRNFRNKQNSLFPQRNTLSDKLFKY